MHIVINDVNVIKYYQTGITIVIKVTLKKSDGYTKCKVSKFKILNNIILKQNFELLSH